MQFGKFHVKKKALLISFHSSSNDGALTYSLLNTVPITPQVSLKAEQMLDFPSLKLNERDTYKGADCQKITSLKE